ncbi:aldose 1-epimerase [Capsulimonas corticalis]|uniref:Aldose 1-epimerase n=1 Tax=Capsulimonas corticalis TaxID=2219043 RepID=A0A402CX97_9BACT|nr:aldose epimerase family protein [Capsulimonas corticalis]BDI32355.1 aldose 1-epimerase [Capsulimonas corticalis]
MKTVAQSFYSLALVAALAGGACAASRDTITQKSFGTAPGGKAVSLYTLTNKNGVQVTITNYGGILTSVKTPDRRGNFGDIALGFDSVSGYVKNPGPYFGALVGRYANRIAKGRFTLDGKTYQLAVNNGVNHLHGGKIGFDKKIWTAKPLHRAGGVGLALTLVSPDGDENFPGALTVKAVYTLSDDNALKIDYTATTSKDTIVNLTNHSYWNLNGAGNGDILGQTMMLNADRYTPIDKTSIPLGPLARVAGTPFDFRKATPIGARIDKDNQQLKNGAGYDHNFVLNQPGHQMILAARAYSPQSGRVLSVFTDQPGIQLYTGNFLDGTFSGKGGKVYKKHYGFALETQHYPDSPNQPKYPTTKLKPGQVYRYTTIFKFSTR